MRIVAKAGLGSIAVLTLVAADSAVAQRMEGSRPGASYPVPGAMPPPLPLARPAPPLMVRPAGRPPVSRWGSSVNGQWWGGTNAPGGYAAYRRPYRGWALPGYWIAPRFLVSDWAGYGLAQPPRDYRWTRYYDDAVLIDAHGSVYDSRGGIDWDRYADRHADHLFHDEGRGPQRRHDGAGGASAGLAASYAIDRAKDRDRRGPPPSPYGYGPDYPPPPPPMREFGYEDGGSRWVSADGATTVTTTSGGYGGGTTVVTVQGSPVVTTTTTTTETYETVARTRPARHRVYRSKYIRRTSR